MKVGFVKTLAGQRLRKFKLEPELPTAQAVHI